MSAVCAYECGALILTDTCAVCLTLQLEMTRTASTTLSGHHDPDTRSVSILLGTSLHLFAAWTTRAIPWVPEGQGALLYDGRCAAFIDCLQASTNSSSFWSVLWRALQTNPACVCANPHFPAIYLYHNSELQRLVCCWFPCRGRGETSRLHWRKR